ncbi:MAG: hypothetical protein JO143_01940 [Acetobacteraceae bacterium]|nr:hypothetical protein [Acetobacteraceae bacterium]
MLVTHPFHPLCGQRLEVLLERRCGGRRVFVCDAGDGRNLELAEDATDRGAVPGERALSFEVLVGLVAVVAAINGGKER